MKPISACVAAAVCPMMPAALWAQTFHIDGVPRTFVFDREGRLAAQSLDMCTQRQFFNMLGRAGLQQEQ